MDTHITQADRDVLKCLPDGWFRHDQVSYRVTRPRFRLERLRRLGLLECRLLLEIASLSPGDMAHVIASGDVIHEYRKTATPQPGPAGGQP